MSKRSWNGTPIYRRSTDGYVDATSMCRANDKRWHAFRESTAATTYIEALSRKTGISVYDLIVSKKGQGTWIHPDVATELARWISPDFSIFINQWFREEYERRTSQTPATYPSSTPRLGPAEKLDLIERSIGLLQRLGVMDERDHLQLGDMVRNTMVQSTSGLLSPASPDDEELTLSDAWLEVTGQPVPTNRGPLIGTALAQLYKEDFHTAPPKRLQYVDGAPRQVNSYKRSWLIPAISRLPKHLRQCSPSPNRRA